MSFRLPVSTSVGALALGIFTACTDAAPTSAVIRGPRSTMSATPTVTVTSTADVGAGTLRSAIANAPVGATITFDPSIAGQTIVVQSPLVLEEGPFVITGDAANGMTLSGGDQSGVFEVRKNAILTIRYLTIAHARGAGFGAIVNSGALIVDHSTLTDNVAPDIGGFSGLGGAIASWGNLVVTNSTISGNGAARAGGGIAVLESSVPPFPNVVIENSTIVKNGSVTGGGGIAVASISGGASANLNLTNTIVAGNSALLGESNCAFAAPVSVVFGGMNIVGTADCGVSPNVLVADPALAPLGPNGGPTFTHALLSTSPAIDAATACAVTDDQRYVARPQGLACDIGAFEFTDFTRFAVAIDPSNEVNPETGSAVITGSLTCSRPTQVHLQVSVNQSQKIKRVNVVAQAADVLTINCTGSSLWAIVLAPSSGGFVNDQATVVAQTIHTAVSELPASTTAIVKLFWSHK